MSQPEVSDSADDDQASPEIATPGSTPPPAPTPAPLEPQPQPQAQPVEDAPTHANDRVPTPPADAAADGPEHERARAQHYEKRCAKLERDVAVHRDLLVSKIKTIGEHEERLKLVREHEELLEESEQRCKAEKEALVEKTERDAVLIAKLEMRVRVLPGFFYITVLSVCAVVGLLVYGAFVGLLGVCTNMLSSLLLLPFDYCIRDMT